MAAVSAMLEQPQLALTNIPQSIAFSQRMYLKNNYNNVQLTDRVGPDFFRYSVGFRGKGHQRDTVHVFASESELCL